MTPAVVIRPMAFPLILHSVNQRFPSGPAVMAQGALNGYSGNSEMTPEGVMRPIMETVPISKSAAVNHRLPSGPATMPVPSA